MLSYKKIQLNAKIKNKDIIINMFIIKNLKYNLFLITQIINKIFKISIIINRLKIQKRFCFAKKQ